VDVGAHILEINAAPLPPNADGRCGRVLVARDVTSRIESEERDIHRERLSVLGEIAAVMAHELNNPLTSIRMFAQMLADGLPDDSAFREHADVIVRNTETCRHSIRELLGYATAAAPEAAPVDVHAVLEDVTRFVRPLAERAGARLETRLEAADDCITGDEIQVRQLFVNLIVNALQASESGVAITLTSSNEDGALVVDLNDSGPGIGPEDRDRVFDAFYSTKPRGEGTGLGLPTARRIAELHGGGVDLVESRPGSTTFRVRLRSTEALVAQGSTG
jgi:two-component system NtrC family sensor kinase